MKIISYIIILLNILTITSTINGQNFDKNIKDSYEKYIYVVDEENVYGDYALVIGYKKNKTYLSCYLYQHNQNKHLYLKIKLDNDLTTFVPDSLVIEGYGLEIKSQSKISIYIFDGEQDILLNEYEIAKLINDLNNHPLIGNGTSKFPKNKKEVSFILKLQIALIIFSLISIGFIVLLVILYKKRVGRFNQQQSFSDSTDNYIDTTYENIDDKKIENDEDSFNEYMSHHQKRDDETQKETKEQIINRLFEEYRTGDISEEELDERLRHLEDDND